MGARAGFSLEFKLNCGSSRGQERHELTNRLRLLEFVLNRSTRFVSAQLRTLIYLCPNLRVFSLRKYSRAKKKLKVHAAFCLLAYVTTR